MQITPGIRCKKRHGRQTAALFDAPKDGCKHQEQGGNVELIKGRSWTADVANMKNHDTAVNERERAGSSGNAGNDRSVYLPPNRLPDLGSRSLTLAPGV